MVEHSLDHVEELSTWMAETSAGMGTEARLGKSRVGGKETKV